MKSTTTNRPRTIKEYVEKRITDGINLETIWRDAEDKFPYQCVGWNYIRNIARRMHAAQKHLILIGLACVPL